MSVFESLFLTEGSLVFEEELPTVVVIFGLGVVVLSASASEALARSVSASEAPVV